MGAPRFSHKNLLTLFVCGATLFLLLLSLTITSYTLLGFFPNKVKTCMLRMEYSSINKCEVLQKRLG
jgi:hypothetical protein